MAVRQDVDAAEGDACENCANVGPEGVLEGTIDGHRVVGVVLRAARRQLGKSASASGRWALDGRCRCDPGLRRRVVERGLVRMKANLGERPVGGVVEPQASRIDKVEYALYGRIGSCAAAQPSGTHFLLADRAERQNFRWLGVVL